MSLYSKLSYKSRMRKHELFSEFFSPDKHMRILDLGAQIKVNSDDCLQFIDMYPWKHNITAVNISELHISKIKKYFPTVNTVVADALQLPWPKDYFDIVYSNAVIEHVGDYENQKKMASEIARVGKKWFITTPNRYFPFEFHLRLPLVTWLPGKLYLWASRIVRYQHLENRYTFFNEKANFRLLSAKELKDCFPLSKIIKQRITLWPETLIAIGPGF